MATTKEKPPLLTAIEYGYFMRPLAKGGFSFSGPGLNRMMKTWAYSKKEFEAACPGLYTWLRPNPGPAHTIHGTSELSYILRHAQAYVHAIQNPEAPLFALSGKGLRVQKILWLDPDENDRVLTLDAAVDAEEQTLTVGASVYWYEALPNAPAYIMPIGGTVWLRMLPAQLDMYCPRSSARLQAAIALQLSEDERLTHAFTPAAHPAFTMVAAGETLPHNLTLES